MRAIVHIGTEKTGSTSIQKYLHSNEAALKEHNIVCCKSAEYRYFHDNYRAAKLLDYALPITEETRLRTSLNINNDQAAITQMHNQMVAGIEKEIASAQENSTFIFSEESLISELTIDDHIDLVHKLLSKYFDEIIIYCYVRRQDQWLSSSFSEILKRGFVPFGLFNLTTDDVFAKKRRLLKYHERYQQWVSHFGERQVIFRPFTKECFYQNDLIADFCHHLNIPKYDITHELRENVSINMEGQLLLLACNRLYQNGEVNDENQKKFTTYIKQTFPGKGFVPTNEQMQVIKKFYDLQNTFLNESLMVLPSTTDEARQLTDEHIAKVGNPTFQKTVHDLIDKLA